MMNNMKQFTIIGPGVMAEAIISGLIKRNIATPENIIAAGPHLERGDELSAKYGIAFTLSNSEAVAQADVLILAVKPQRLANVFKDLAGKIPPQALIISIVAGKTLEVLHNGLQHPAIVRVMPNTPAQIGEGISVWIASDQVSPSQLAVTEHILTALGEEIRVNDENMLDMATALSGSGPAYVFLFMEALIDAGVHFGFPRRFAEKLVTNTVRGSVDYYASKSNHPATLRNEVTSPGDTSAEALYFLEKAGFRTAISRAVWAAFERSQQLGLNKPRDVYGM